MTLAPLTKCNELYFANANPIGVKRLAAANFTSSLAATIFSHFLKVTNKADSQTVEALAL